MAFVRPSRQHSSIHGPQPTGQPLGAKSPLAQLHESLSGAIGALNLCDDHASSSLVAAMERIDQLTASFLEAIGNVVAQVRMEVSAERDRTLAEADSARSLLEAAAQELARERANLEALKHAQAAELARGWQQLRQAQEADRQERAEINARWQLLQQQGYPLVQPPIAAPASYQPPQRFDPYTAIAQFLHKGEITIPDDPSCRTILRREAAATGLQELVHLLDEGRVGSLGYDSCSDPAKGPTRGKKVYAVGGAKTAGTALDTVEVLNLEKDTWRMVAALNDARCYHSVCTSFGHPGFIYCLGGTDGSRVLDSVEEYNAMSDDWTPLPSLVSRRGWLASAVARGVLLAIGGYDDKDYLASVEGFDINKEGFKRQQWQALAPMPKGRRSALGAAALHGIVYAVGGFRAPEYLATCEAYDVRSDRWWGIPPLKEPRRDLGVATLNESMVAVGGYNGRSFLATCEAYDPRMDTWRDLPPLHSPRHLLGVTAVGASIYAIGGHNGSSTSRVVEEYDARMNVWRTLPSLITDRLGLGSATL